MLSPKRVKHRKQHRGRMPGMAKGGTRVEFGEYGLKAIDRGWVTNRQIEAARIAMTRKIKLGGNARKELFNLRFQHATGQLENTAGLKKAKRDLARGLTAVRERGLDVER